MARVHQVNVNPEGGVPKHRVPSARLLQGGVEGDRQRNLRVHGGPDRAVCLFSLERLKAMQEEGHRTVPGSLGENLTLEGLDWSAVQPGAKLQVGQALLEITKATTPCSNLAYAFKDGDFSRVSEKRHPGWSRMYARVLQEGLVQEGDSVGLAAQG